MTNTSPNPMQSLQFPRTDATAGPEIAPPPVSGPASFFRQLRRTTALAGMVALAAACSQTSAAPAKPTGGSSGAAVHAASASQPVVLELFQSQGCSSCPPANANINALAGRPDVIALSFAVTYWDQLGWKDIFAKQAYTDRQWDYSRGLHGDGVYTPQVVINGRSAVVGINRGELDRTIASVGPVAQRLDVSQAGGKLKLSGVVSRQSATVWLVRYDPGIRNVPIRAGENSGRTLPHRDVVRELVKLGPWQGTTPEFALPQAHEGGLASAILVQGGTGGPIIAARRI